MLIGTPSTHLVHAGRQNVTKININTLQFPNCKKKKKKKKNWGPRAILLLFYLNFLSNTHTQILDSLCWKNIVCIAYKTYPAKN